MVPSDSVEMRDHRRMDQRGDAHAGAVRLAVQMRRRRELKDTPLRAVKSSVLDRAHNPNPRWTVKVCNG